MPEELGGGWGERVGEERMAGESKQWGLSVKQRKHVTLDPAPICESPGVTWPGRAGSPTHNSEQNRHRCPPSFWFLCRQIPGNPIGRADFLQPPDPPPFLTLAAAPREISITEEERILGVRGPCAPLVLTVRLWSRVRRCSV